MLSKKQQCFKAQKNKKNRLSKEEYKKYTIYLADMFPICQDTECNDLADDHHHVEYAINKNDKKLINLCRFHHIKAHENKKESQEKYMDIADNNWNIYQKML